MSACKWCEGSGIVLLAGERHDSIERCESCARFVNKAEAFAVIFEAMKPLPAAKPTPPPASPLKFESLKEMGEHIARLADALEQGKEIERFDSSLRCWVLAGVGDTRSRAHLKPELFRLKPAPVKPGEWWISHNERDRLFQTVCADRALAEDYSKKCGFTLKRLIEWPEGAELPDLPA